MYEKVEEERIKFNTLFTSLETVRLIIKLITNPYDKQLQYL